MKEISKTFSAGNDYDISYVGLSYQAIFNSKEDNSNKEDRCHSKAYNMLASSSG